MLVGVCIFFKRRATTARGNLYLGKIDTRTHKATLDARENARIGCH